MRRKRFGKRGGERHRQQRGDKSRRGEQIPEHDNAQSADHKDAQAPLKGSLVGLVGEEGACVVFEPSEPHAYGLGEPVAQTIDQQGHEHEFPLLARAEIHRQRDDDHGRRAVLRHQPEHGVRAVLRTVDGQEHGLEHGKALPDRAGKNGDRADADQQAERLGYPRLLVGEHGIQGEWQEEDREVIDLPRVVYLHAMMPDQ
jgi:hypothetical protein